MPEYFLSADSQIINKNKDNYIAVSYDMSDKDDIKMVYIKATEQSRKKTAEIDFSNTQLQLLPILSNDNEQRDVMVIFGASGSGKSYLSNQIATMYHVFNPTKKIYFISNNNYMEDKALTHSMYTFLKLNELIETYAEKEEIEDFKNSSVDYKNSLIVFDDIDFDRDVESKKIFFSFLNIILKFKRKANISVIFTTHDVTDFMYTRPLFNEMTCYISFSGDLKNRSNRVYKDYLKLTSQELDKIANNQSSRWTCVKTRYKLVITEKEIYRLL